MPVDSAEIVDDSLEVASSTEAPDLAVLFSPGSECENQQWGPYLHTPRAKNAHGLRLDIVSVNTSQLFSFKAVTRPAGTTWVRGPR